MGPFYWHDVAKAQALEGLPMDAWAQSAFGKSENQVTFDLVADLKKLSAPTLIIEGNDDLIAPHFVQEGLRNSTLTPVSSSSNKADISHDRGAGQIHPSGERLRAGMKVSDSPQSEIFCLPPALGASQIGNFYTL
jgi:hypothetical protein